MFANANNCILICILVVSCSSAAEDSRENDVDDRSIVYGENERLSRAVVTSNLVRGSLTGECTCVQKGECPHDEATSQKNPTIILCEPPTTICCGVNLSKGTSPIEVGPIHVTSENEGKNTRKRRQAIKRISQNQSSAKNVSQNQSSAKNVSQNPSSAKNVSQNQSSAKNVSQNQSSAKNVSQNPSSAKNVSQNQSSAKNVSQNQSSVKNVSQNQSRPTTTKTITKKGNETTDSPPRQSDQCECVSASDCDKKNVVTVFGKGLKDESEVHCSNDGDVCCRTSDYSPPRNSTATLDKQTEVDAVIVLVRDKRAATKSTFTPSSKSPQKGEKKQGGNKVNFRGGSGASQLVNVRVGGQSVQCGCVLFYQCDNTDVVTVDEGQDDSAVRCSGDQEVCCRVPNALAGDGATSSNPFGNFDPSTSEQPPINNGGGQPPINNGGGQPPINNGGGQPSINNGGGQPPVNNGGGQPPINNGGGQPPINNGGGQPPINNGGGQPPVNNGGGQPSVPGTEDEQFPQQGECYCAQFFLCPNNASNTDGAGIIDKRMSCVAPEVVCCPGGADGGILDTTNAPTRPPSPIYEPTEQTCGIRRSLQARSENPIATRIIAPAEIGSTYFGEFPWMGIVLRREVHSDGTETDNVFQCGASLIHPSVLLTAAHCVRQLDIATLKVRMGEWDTNVGVGGEPLPHQDRRVRSIVVHPNFHTGALFNDLALIQVDRAFDIAENVNTICLQAQGGYDRRTCVATGWGKHAFDSSGRFQTILKKVNLRIIDNNECVRALRKTKLGPKFVLHESFICAGGSRGQDTCQGDGGGPLVCAVNGHADTYVQTGVVSWGIGCGDDIPAAYASTLDYQPAAQWIRRQLDTLARNIINPS